jgi:lipopolysaccharide transport system permease protein
MATEELQPRVRPRPVAASVTPVSGETTLMLPRRAGIPAALGELWHYRRYTLFLGRRFIAKRYRRTWLGPIWLVLKPSLSVGAKLIAFGGLVGVSGGNVPYPLFFLTATAAWQLFHEGAYWSTRSLDINRRLLTTVHVPRVVVIVGAIFPSLIEFGVALGMAGVALLYYVLRAHTLYLNLTMRSPLYVGGSLAAIVLLGVGIGLVTATLGARARDVRFTTMFSLGFVYYLTPVIYPFSAIPNGAKPIAELNPVTGAMEAFKYGLFKGEAPSSKALIVTVVAVVLLWVPGWWLFQRQEARNW